MRNAPWVLGIAASHNGAACLLRGDELVVGIQEERLLRAKRAAHPGARHSLAIQYCLDYARISPRDLAVVAISSASIQSDPHDDVALNSVLHACSNDIPIVKVSHHTAHAVGAFATSGFAEAAVLVVDGWGSPIGDLNAAEQGAILPGQLAAPNNGGIASESISCYFGRGTETCPIEKHVSYACPSKPGMQLFRSLGTMYASVAGHIFESGPFDSAGKMMGLAPYGTPTIPVSAFYSINDGGFVFSKEVPERHLERDPWPNRRKEYENLAASTQRALEEALLYLVRNLKQKTGAKRLCYAGGVALNSVANERIVREGGFEEVFFMPAAEDSGTAIGAAYYGLWQLTGRNTEKRLVQDAVGRPYGETEIQKAAEKCPGVYISSEEDVFDEVVRLLDSGKIVGWLNGRSELGPRALGQRSILCDPRRAEMKDLLNRTVKFRESFRPFAPMVPLEKVHEYFEVEPGTESPYMLRVIRFRADVRERVPAVVHVDGTGRVQTVTENSNPRLYELLQRFGERTGCPILLNTSFNVAGEPIVETPEDALNCLMFSGLDACVLENRIVRKLPGFRSPLELVPFLTIERLHVDSPAPRLLETAADGDKPDIQFFYSFHIDQIKEVYEIAASHARSSLWIIVSTPWGKVLHVTNVGVMNILKRVDGKRTGYELLELIRRECRSEVDEKSWKRVIGHLKKSGIIDFIPVNVGKHGPLVNHRAPGISGRNNPVHSFNKGVKT